MIHYTGIGSRSTPSDQQLLMRWLGKQLALQGWTLRSGGATGADQAFAAGTALGSAPGAHNMEIYLPWRGFAGQKGVVASAERFEAAERIVAGTHPLWARLPQAHRRLHARNAFQVLGLDLESPSALVACWTPDGSETLEQTSAATGGTGTAIRLAHARGIPVFNLARENALERLASHARQLGVADLPRMPAEMVESGPPTQGEQRSLWGRHRG